LTGDEQLFFIIGKDTSDFLKVEVLDYEHPALSEYWDANWLKAKIKLKIGAFSANYLAQLQTTNFREFQNGLETLYKDLIGEAQFYSLEDWLRIKLSGDGIGHFSLDCQASDFPGTGSRLEFEMQIDQTEIPLLVRQLSEILERFPVKGKPDNATK